MYTGVDRQRRRRATEEWEIMMRKKIRMEVDEEFDRLFAQVKLTRIKSNEPKLEAFLSESALKMVKEQGPFDLTTPVGLGKFKRKILLITHPDKQRPESIYHTEFSNFFEAHKKWQNEIDDIRAGKDLAGDGATEYLFFADPVIPVMPLDRPVIKLMLPLQLPSITTDSMPQLQKVIKSTQKTLEAAQKIEQKFVQPVSSFIDEHPRCTNLIEDMCVDDTNESCLIVDFDQSARLDVNLPPLVKVQKKKSKKRHSSNVVPLDTFSKKSLHSVKDNDFKTLRIRDDEFDSDEKVHSTQVKIECKTMDVKNPESEPKWLKLAKLLIRYAKERDVRGEFNITPVYDFIFKIECMDNNKVSRKTVRTWQQALQKLLSKRTMSQLHIEGHGIIEQILTKKNGVGNHIRYRIWQ